jgi:hypothetical protein
VMRPHVVDKIGSHSEGDATLGASVGGRRTQRRDGNGRRVTHQGGVDQINRRENRQFLTFVFLKR